MNRTLCVLAALAALAALTTGGAALAQSGINFYGRIDASVGRAKVTAGGLTPSDPGLSITSGSYTASRWGITGTEDLGNGLEARFTLEQGFNVDTGSAAAGSQFDRQSFVGLAGGFGSLTIGRQYDLLDQFTTNFDPFAKSGGYSAQLFAFTTPAAAAAGPAARRLGNYLSRQNNAVQYASPAIGGVQVRVLWAPGEDKLPGMGGAGENYGMGLSYATGALSVGGVYQVNQASGARGIDQWLLGASYNFGPAKVFGQVQAGKNRNVPGTARDDGCQLGLSIPLGAFTVIASYAAEDQTTAGIKVSDTSAIGLAGQYSLSKRTYVYGAYRQGEVDPRGAAATTRERRYGLGLVHMF